MYKEELQQGNNMLPHFYKVVLNEAYPYKSIFALQIYQANQIHFVSFYCIFYLRLNSTHSRVQVKGVVLQKDTPSLLLQDHIFSHTTFERYKYMLKWSQMDP